jgi:hypothetical protein
MHTEEHVLTWDTVTYDYLHIAYRSWERLSARGVSEGNDEAFWDVLKCCIFSFLCIDGIFNYLWHVVEYEEREKNITCKDAEYWKKIETPKKWIKKNPYERINLLSLTYSGKKFFESVKHTSCLDLFKDYIEFRNALFHSSPDITYTIEKYLGKSDVGVARYSVLNREKITPEGRKRTFKKSRLSEWVNLQDLHQTHALEVYKFTLALLYRTSEIFLRHNMPFNAIHFQKNKPDFKDAYRQLPKCYFDEVLKQELNM